MLQILDLLTAFSIVDLFSVFSDVRVVSWEN